MTHLNDLSKIYLEQIAESAVPGKPAEKVGALTNIDIPQSERDAARQRLLAKTAAKRKAMQKEEFVDPEYGEAPSGRSPLQNVSDHPKASVRKKAVKGFRKQMEREYGGKWRSRTNDPVKEALDPVGQEDDDIDNDGVKNDKNDKYIRNKRKAIGKAISKKKGEECDDCGKKECECDDKESVDEIYLATPASKPKKTTVVKKVKSDAERYGEDPAVTRERMRRKQREYASRNEELELDEKIDVRKQSSKRKSLGRGSSINPDAKKTGYESPAEFRKTEKKLAPYMEAKNVHGEVEVPSVNIGKLAKKASARIDTDVDGDVEHNDKHRGEYGEFVPTPDGKKYSGMQPAFKGPKKVRKESFSNWRQDLIEVTDEEGDKQIKEMSKGKKNKVTINPKLSESIENLGGTLLEMNEIDVFMGILDELTDTEISFLNTKLIEQVVSEVFFECLEEGYEVGEIEDILLESIDTSTELLSEAKVTGDVVKTDRLKKVRSAVKKVGKAVIKGAGYAAGAAVRGVKAAGKAFSSGYQRGRYGSGSGSSGGSGSSSSTSSSVRSVRSDGGSGSSSSGSARVTQGRETTKRPGLLSRIGSKLKSGLKKAVAGGARAISRGARNVARKVEGGSAKPKVTQGRGVDKTSSTSAEPAAKPKVTQGRGVDKTSSTSAEPAAKPKTQGVRPADPWRGSYTTGPKKSEAAPAAKAPEKKAQKADRVIKRVRAVQKTGTLKKKKKSDKLDSLLASIRNEEFQLDEVKVTRVVKPEVRERAKNIKNIRDKKAALAALMKHAKLQKQGLRDSFEIYGEEINEKAVSKKQQRFMGMVYAAKKGEKPASPEVAQAAASISKSEAKNFAKTKHKGLPSKVKTNESMAGEIPMNDKEIMLRKRAAMIDRQLASIRQRTTQNLSKNQKREN